jgi:PTS system mannose-specific IIB component/fructoselysine and glucoselysine-specific PTS system IIB component
MSWLLHRVDDRLIHGQVVVAWGQRLNPQRIWVVDDCVAASDWERELLESSAPGIVVRVCGVAVAAAGWEAERDAAGGAFLLVRDLATALRLVEAGARVTRFTLGGLHYAPGKEKVNEYVYLDAADRAAARALIARGIALEVQDVPAARAVALAELDPLSASA